MTYGTAMKSRGTIAALAAALISLLTYAPPARAGEHAEPISVRQVQTRTTTWGSYCVHERRHRVVKQYGAPGYPSGEDSFQPSRWSRWRPYKYDTTLC